MSCTDTKWLKMAGYCWHNVQDKDNRQVTWVIAANAVLSVVGLTTHEEVMLLEEAEPRKTPEKETETVGCGCKFYEEPNQKFERSKYSTILWTWKLLSWPQATLAKHCWKALSHRLQWSEHSHVWGHWVWYLIDFVCFQFPLKGPQVTICTRICGWFS